MSRALKARTTQAEERVTAPDWQTALGHWSDSTEEAAADLAAFAARVGKGEVAERFHALSVQFAGVARATRAVIAYVDRVEGLTRGG